jgi:hypothetical protein
MQLKYIIKTPIILISYLSISINRRTDMTHWGWYWKIKKKHVSRTLCSTLISIDSFTLLKTNSNATGFNVYPLSVAATIKDDHLQVTYGKRKEMSYSIAIDKQPCNYGGFRTFFKCPLCHKRMRLLYFAQNSIFLCRKCLNLSYTSQSLRPTRRYDYMNSKIKESVKKKGGDLDQYKKPPQMHNDSFKQLQNKQYYYKSKSNQALNKELREWHGNKIEPYLDNFFDYVDENMEWRRIPASKKKSALSYL